MKTNSLILPLGTRIAGVLMYLLIFIILAALSSAFESDSLEEISNFLKDNLLLILLINGILFISDVFGLLIFPLNIPKGLFQAFASICIVTFIIHTFKLVDILFSEDLYGFINSVSVLIYPLVFIITLLYNTIQIIQKNLHNRKN